MIYLVKGHFVGLRFFKYLNYNYIVCDYNDFISTVPHLHENVTKLRYRRHQYLPQQIVELYENWVNGTNVHICKYIYIHEQISK